MRYLRRPTTLAVNTVLWNKCVKSMMHDAHIYMLTVNIVIFGIENGGEWYIFWNNSLFKLVEYKVCVDFKLPNLTNEILGII